MISSKREQCVGGPDAGAHAADDCILRYCFYTAYTM